MFVEGQSTITWILSFVVFEKWFIMAAVFSASRVFRFSWLSISWGVEIRILDFSSAFIFSLISALCFGERSFESFAPHALISSC